MLFKSNTGIVQLGKYFTFPLCDKRVMEYKYRAIYLRHFYIANFKH